MAQMGILFATDGPHDGNHRIRETIRTLFQNVAVVDNPMGPEQVAAWLNFIFPAIEGAYWDVPVYTALAQRERILTRREERWLNNTRAFFQRIGQDPEPFINAIYHPAPAAEGGA